MSFNSIVKSAPNANCFALWADAATKVIYAWGGAGPYGDTTGASNVHLWAFTPDNQGAGSWAVSIPNNPSVFTTLIRASEGGATSCNGMGYFLGGVAEHDTDTRVSGTIYSPPGLLTYDMSSATWENVSAPAPYATFNFGQVECLPFGPDGLVMFFGGGSNSPTDNAEFTPFSLNNLTIYNPATKEWFWQSTSGDVPPHRNQFCSVGVAGNNGTYEM